MPVRRELATAPLIGLLLLASCIQSGSPTPGPSASISSPGPATTAPTPPAAFLAPDTTAQVVTTDLVIRSAPGGGPDSEVYPGALDAPTLLFVLDGPVTASGYEWYLVQPFLTDGYATAPGRLGWVAAGSREGEAWIAPVALECPSPDLAGLLGWSPVALLACFGDRVLTLDGTFGGSSYIVPGVVSPSWLGIGLHTLRPPGTDPNAPPVPRTYFTFHVADDDPTDGDQLDFDLGAAIRIVGHFDDPVAQTCIAGLLPGEPSPATAAETELRAQGYVMQCRAKFVATEVSPLSQ